MNGFKDDDGCPDEPDRDNDGVAGMRGAISARTRPKTPTAFQDTDGLS